MAWNVGSLVDKNTIRSIEHVFNFVNLSSPLIVIVFLCLWVLYIKAELESLNGNAQVGSSKMTYSGSQNSQQVEQKTARY